MADGLLGPQVRRAASRLRFQDPTLWINDSVYAPLPSMTGWPSLYDITDDWLLACAGPREHRRRQRREERLLEAADAVVVCSPALAATRGTGRAVHLIPNGVDVEHFRRPRKRPADLPPGPTGVYVGTLHDERLDVDLVASLAASLAIEASTAQIVLVGPNFLSPASTQRLSRLPNLHLLGPRPYDVVPAYWQHADVVIVPHQVSAFTETLDPIKAYECLAAGRPTLATPVAGFRGLGGPVLCVPAEGFAAALSAWLRSPPPPGKVSELASWTSRARSFADVVDNVRQGVTEAPWPSRKRRSPLPDLPSAAPKVDRRRLRVVFVDHCAQLSGAELALVRLLPALPEVSAHVVLAEDGPLVSRLQGCGASVEVAALDERARSLPRHQVGWQALAQRQALRWPAYVVFLARRLRALRPDVVHTYSLKAFLYGGLAARLAGLPVVWHLHDRVAVDYLPAHAVRLVQALGRWLPTTVVVNSQATLATLGHRPRWRSGPTRTVIQYPVPTVPPRSRPEEGMLRVGMVGRLAPWKGQHVFLEALAHAGPDLDRALTGRGWEAVIVGAPLFGETQYEDDLRRLCGDLGLGPQVRFLGFRDDVVGELASMDVLVHASVLPEPFGQVVAEGMAAGLAVIAAAPGGPAEVIDHGVTGLLYPAGDAEALAIELRKLVADPVLRAELGRAARARSGAFSPATIAGQVMEVYLEVLEPRGGRLRRRRPLGDGHDRRRQRRS
jgi:glycosyltransferase involved in cell wall biosynthesis